MIKVAMIGAGSVVFSKNLTGDILSYPEFKNATLCYMDINQDRLDVGVNLCRKVAKALGATPRIEGTRNLRKALEGADFVINMVQIGGMDSTLVDFEIPRKYGLNFTIADTTGPGGLFRALRTYPMLSGLCQDMTDLCPSAWLLNYSNPMSMNMQTISRTSGIKAVGLCHSVQGTFDQLMRYIGEDPAKCEFLCAGINHMAFYLQIRKGVGDRAEDLYPRLFKAMKDPNVYNSNKVRFELMKVLGHFVTESSEHNAEYNPYFIPRGRETIEKYWVPIDEYLRRCDGIVDEFHRMKKFAKSKEPLTVHRSHEYGSTIIHSIVTGKPSVVYGNMPNRGAIANLPDSAITEVPTLVDRAGCQFTTVGEIPPQLAAYMMPHVNQHELFIRAAMEGRRDHVYQAAMFDPLAGASMTLDKIVAMCDELIAAHGKRLPALDARKTRVPTSGKRFSGVSIPAMYESWRKARAMATSEFVKDWQVIGAFLSPRKGKVSLTQRTPVEDDFLRNPAAAPDFKAVYKAGGKTFKWARAVAEDTTGVLHFTRIYGPIEWSVGYAYAEIESIHPRDAVLKVGSDDGVKMWLNGKVVHTNEVARGYSPGADQVKVHFQAGVNRLLVKLDNYIGGWSVSVQVPAANF